MPRPPDLRTHLRQLKAWSHETFPELEESTGLTRSQIHGYFYGKRRPKEEELQLLLTAMRAPAPDRRLAFMLAWPIVAQELTGAQEPHNQINP